MPKRRHGLRRRGAQRWTRTAIAVGAALVLARTAGAQEPRVTRSEPEEVQVLGRTAVELVVWGSGLDQVTAASVLDSRGRAFADTDVRIVERGRDWIRLRVTIGDRAPVGAAGTVALLTSSQRVSTPGRVVVQSPPPLGFVPVALETDGLRMTGIRFHAVTIEAGALVMTGVRFKPVIVQTAPLVMTGNPD
jgi:hypothetical protein